MGTGMYAAYGVLVSLFDREKTGQGRKIEANLLDTAISWMCHFIADYSISGELPSRMGSALSAFSPYQVFRTADKYVFVGISTERFWKAFCDEFALQEIYHDPRFRTNADRCRNREELTQKLGQVFKQYSSKMIIEKLNAIGVPCAPVLSLDEVLEDPHVLSRRILQEVDHPEYGLVNVTKTPLGISGKMPDIYLPAPMLGQHTKEVLMEIGYDSASISKLAAKGAIVLAHEPQKEV
jgi:crotonobetainyl-CoA:carnitine CoA-transferase CaiB-like acyl-CoA transferase